MRDKKYPLKISVRGQPDYTIHLVIEEIFKAHGFTGDDLRSWAGDLVYQNDLPSPHRVQSVTNGECDALLDEAVGQWVNQGLSAGMKILPISEPAIQKLEADGFRRGTLPKSLYPGLPADVETLDYSGFILYTHKNTPGDMVQALGAATEARKDVIPRDQDEGPLPLDRMCKDTPEGPLYIPLHNAAEACWTEHGYL